MDGKGVSVKWQSRRGLSPPSSRQGWWSRYSNTSPTVVPGLSTCGCGRLSWTIVTQARTHSRSSGTGSRSTAAPSAGAGMCSTVLRFFHFLYWTIVTQGPCWRRHRERERHAPPFLTLCQVDLHGSHACISRLLVNVHDALHMSAGSPPCMSNTIQVAAAEHVVTAELHRAARMPRGALSHMTY